MTGVAMAMRHCVVVLALFAGAGDADAQQTNPPSPAAQSAAQPGAEGPSRADEPLVRRGIYDRPYLARSGIGGYNIAIGGYLEFLGSYVREDGLSDGLSFEARRFNLFVTSQISDRIRMTSELEFEHGTQEIALETALLDVTLNPALNLRSGVILVPIGKFNIAHDAPLYDVIDRPLVSTEIIPATLSEVGIGVFGGLYPGGRHKLAYELYLVNGLQDGVIAAQGTRLPAGKAPSAFEADNNGRPALTGRLAYQTPLRAPVALEIAGSFYSGLYNTFQLDGEDVDDPRWLHILAVDMEMTYKLLSVRGELAYARIDVPDSLTPLHGRAQLGAYVDAIATLYACRLGPFARVNLAAVARLDYVDLNRGQGPLTGDETVRLTLGPSFRPASGTAIRLMYYYQWQSDALNNPIRSAGLQFGVATYF